jgi:hypothetical protein
MLTYGGVNSRTTLFQREERNWRETCLRKITGEIYHQNSITVTNSIAFPWLRGVPEGISSGTWGQKTPRDHSKRGQQISTAATAYSNPATWLPAVIQPDPQTKGC